MCWYRPKSDRPMNSSVERECSERIRRLTMDEIPKHCEVTLRVQSHGDTRVRLTLVRRWQFLYQLLRKRVVASAGGPMPAIFSLGRQACSSKVYREHNDEPYVFNAMSVLNIAGRISTAAIS